MESHSLLVTGQVDELTLPDIERFKPEVVVIPVGSTEAHGYHLPYGTDTWRVQAHVGRAVALANERGARVLALPAMPYGINVNFLKWPLTVRLRVETLLAVMTDLVKGLDHDGIRKIVVFNGHGGNRQALEAFLRQVHQETEAVVMLMHPGGGVSREFYQSLWKRGEGEHAGEGETAEILYLRPETVRMEQMEPPVVRRPKIDLDAMRAVYVKRWQHYSNTSGVGDPTDATAEQGRLWIDASSEALAVFLKELSDAPFDSAFPF